MVMIIYWFVYCRSWSWQACKIQWRNKWSCMYTVFIKKLWQILNWRKTWNGGCYRLLAFEDLLVIVTCTMMIALILTSMGRTSFFLKIMGSFTFFWIYQSYNRQQISHLCCCVCKVLVEICISYWNNLV